MSFLAPWALALGVLGAAGVVLLHLVARQRPAAYLLPTTRFVPDKRTLVSRAATRPRDLLLLLLRVLLLLAAAAAFARPVITPRRGAIARVFLLDRSRSVGSMMSIASRAREVSGENIPATFIAFDSATTVVPIEQLDSLGRAPASASSGSLSAALVAARRASVALADRADSVQLIVVSPLAASELDAATSRVRAEWPGGIRIERVAAAEHPATPWRLEHPLPVSDVLGPAVAALTGAPDALVARLVRGGVSADDSAFARSGGTVVVWDSASARHAGAEGLASGGDVIVASLERRVAPAGRVVARWADGAPAASEMMIGRGCLRTVGVGVSAAGDLALYPPFERIARRLLAPCGFSEAEVPADSSVVRMLAGKTSSAASGASLRITESRPSPLARWLLAFALALALAELAVRSRGEQPAV